MADDERTVAQPTAFWGTIERAVRERATTAEVWQAIRDYSAASGLATPPNLFQEVNRLRSLSAANRNAGEALTRAAPSDALTGSMLGSAIYARGGNEQALAPLYHVRFELTAQTAAESSTSWYTLEYSGGLPATVGDLLGDVFDYGVGLADSYGSSFVSVGRVEITAF